ncbi:hypothetical protein PHJA_002380700 [Phtheirospermum japonicum]|uniref:Uncharacterized protein n=1 Tax=Phtheirospermum japonicum TaxID=374723 RepID=A0A830CT63_9LAMI|nr:hypothetical protein PHJA_002380700 [Phtheirospermum japonicum]
MIVYFRTYVVYSGVEPGIPPSGPPSNILSWVVAVAIAVVVPFISYKWGPTLKNKIETVMQKTEDVVEAVEKVAGKVEKVAEDILDDLPKGGKLREAVDFVEKLAERTRIDAGAVDDFIDKVLFLTKLFFFNRIHDVLRANYRMLDLIRKINW